ncbi:MAG: AsmA family protein [Thiomonas sp. SCN 64-16]|uniref:AsmA family protein n=1 Tax=Thiomonas sp. SCN 64-16 TaxID=1660151 RepID=UPI00086CCDCB|nr:AsmA family protein [Thiomonas sp. SCN 64-16]ODU96530.1 MAG: AsmA family protein [Thiomonas sp. SCN 64-16]
MTEVTAPQPDAPAPRRRWPMRLFKGLLAALLAAVILVVGGMSILLLTFDPNQYKATLIQVVQEREHRTLTLPGTIELTLFPPLTLRTGPFSLSERDSPAVFARADDLRLHLDLFALLRRKLVVDRVVMIKPQIHVARDAQGRLNFADLLPDSKPESAPPRSPLGLSVHRLQVEQGVLFYDDDKAKLHGQLDGLDVGLSGLDGGNAGAFHLETTARFVQPALATRIALRGKLLADTAQHSVVLTDLALSAQGDVPGLKAMQTQLNADQLGLRTGSMWALTTRQWRIKTTGRTESGENLSAQISLPTLEAKGDTVQIGPLDASAEIGAVQALQLQCKAQQAAGAWSALRVPVAQCDVQRGAAGKTGAMRLTLASPLQLDLTHAHYVLPAIKLSGQLTPGAKPQTLALQGNAQYDGGANGPMNGPTAQFQLQGLVAGSGMKLSGGWAQPDTLRLDVNADRLNLDDWLPPPAAQPKAAAPASIDLSAFQKLGLGAQFKIGSLLFKGMQWSAVQGQLTSDRKTLALQPFTAQGFGGSVDANLRVNLAQQQYTLQQSGRDVSVQPVLQALVGKDFLLGKANWTMNLSAQGKTLPALIASLSGKARLDVRNGAVKGFNLAQMLRNARALLAARKDGQFAATPGEQTDFTALGATFVLQNGVANNSDLMVQSPLLRVGGEGWFDLPRQRLDYLLLPAVVGPLRGQGGADLAVLRGVTVPVRIAGSFAQPSYTVLWSQAGGNLLKQTLKNTLQNELQKQLAPAQAQPLQKGVPGLFKGLFP